LIERSRIQSSGAEDGLRPWKTLRVFHFRTDGDDWMFAWKIMAAVWGRIDGW
jgi:hypothetical protein